MFGARNLFLTAAGLPIDSDFEYVTLLLNGDGTNGGQNNTFLDSSTNNFTITRNGNTTQGSFSPYGTLWSNYFGGSGNYLTAPSNAAFNIEGGSYTIEFFAFYNGFVGGDRFFVMTGSSQTFGLLVGTSSANDIEVNQFGTGTVITGTNALVGLSNKWAHICVVSNGTNRSIFVNGTRFATTTSALFQSSNNAVGIAGVGGTYSGGNPNGYISNFRLVKGTAVYDPTQTTLTVPTTPLTAITNTSLLTCQSNRFIDNSANNFTLTVNGTPSVQRFSPFEPSAPYSTSVIGGSGYFDGSGDYLTLANDAAYQFGSGEFTIDGWFYSTSSGDQVVISRWSSPDSNSAWEIIRFSGTTYFQVASGSSAISITTSSFPLNQWNHFAMSKSSSTMAAWLNGTRIGTASVSSVNNGDQGPSIGVRSGGTSFPFAGYLANLRVVKGTDVYGVSNTTITVPTAPTTAITNTSLLTNFTNASIPDLAMQNNLETVGNAQVSTSVKKYGAGSLAFDGDGDWLSAPATPQTDLGSGDFTIECWLYRTASGAASDSGIVSRGAPSTTNGFVFGYTSSNVLTFNFNYSGAIVTGSTAISVNTWTHVAITRSGSTFRLFVNGTVDATATSSNSQTTNSSDVFYIGRSGFSSDRIVTGYIDDVRITKGLARYTANFTAPTSALPTY